MLLKWISTGIRYIYNRYSVCWVDVQHDGILFTWMNRESEIRPVGLLRKYQNSGMIERLAPVHNFSLKAIQRFILAAYGRNLFLREEPWIKESDLITLDVVATEDGTVTGLNVNMPKRAEFPAVVGTVSDKQASAFLTNWLSQRVAELGGKISKVTWHAPKRGQSAFMPFASVHMARA